MEVPYFGRKSVEATEINDRVANFILVQNGLIKTFSSAVKKTLSVGVSQD